MMNRSIAKQQRGISLLEVLLSLTIIFIILLMATRYYETTEASAKANESIRMLNAVAAAADDWFVTYKTYRSADGKVAITKQALIDMGDLPAAFGGTNTANPWGGEITIVPKDSTHVTIGFTKVPHAECLNLKALMAQRMTGNCTEQGGYEATYPVDLLK